MPQLLSPLPDPNMFSVPGPPTPHHSSSSLRHHWTQGDLRSPSSTASQARQRSSRSRSRLEITAPSSVASSRAPSVAPPSPPASDRQSATDSKVHFETISQIEWVRSQCGVVNLYKPIQYSGKVSVVDASKGKFPFDDQPLPLDGMTSAAKTIVVHMQVNAAFSDMGRINGYEHYHKELCVETKYGPMTLQQLTHQVAHIILAYVKLIRKGRIGPIEAKGNIPLTETTWNVLEDDFKDKDLALVALEHRAAENWQPVVALQSRIGTRRTGGGRHALSLVNSDPDHAADATTSMPHTQQQQPPAFAITVPFARRTIPENDIVKHSVEVFRITFGRVALKMVSQYLNNTVLESESVLFTFFEIDESLWVVAHITRTENEKMFGHME
ncbi:hypothetical protein EW146_g6320 [Bondarzewia mesenterica]|uniref:Uncharacterized protein n=1 Tax=Bondarzewia mesenterica TaxID=1095465 RepID=A0A4S4LR14_9AGAM|nr:hypothetical protein EW146_g6320 [Bondarzewia mesenterica]